MIRIVIAGAAGRMGLALIRCLRQVEGIELVGAIEHEQHTCQGKDAGEIAGAGTLGVSVTPDPAAVLGDADVLVDFSSHLAVPRHARVVTELRRAWVLGTTGLTAEETESVNRAADSVPVMWAPNMSLGVNLLFAMARRAASVLGTDYTTVIDETHHVHKRDAPSGTALRLGENVAEGLGKPPDEVLVCDPDGHMPTAPEGRILIRSHREGEVVGDHTVLFDGPGESLGITHHAKSRDAFALGALHAAKWICRRRPRRYDMQDVLGLRGE